MKLLIGGKIRNIYMRKDGSAYYKSGGQQVDASFLFKKNGGGLKKQYIDGVEGNLVKVERKKRLNKCAKQILGGGPSDIILFAPIAIDSEKLDTGTDGSTDDAVNTELAKLCYIALNGLSIKFNDPKQVDIAKDKDKDKIKISILDEYRFTEYADKNIDDTIRNNIYREGDSVGQKIKADLAKGEGNSKLKKLGFTGIDFKDGITVTRAYILNKILQCFDTPDLFTLTPDTPLPRDGVLQKRQIIIDPEKGNFRQSVDTNQIFNNIVDVLKICIAKKHDKDNKDNLHPIVNYLHTILFTIEKIGSPK